MVARASLAEEDRDVSILWLIGVICVAVIAICTLIDLIRRNHFSWPTFGWGVLIVILPLIGSIIYWAVRPVTWISSQRRASIGGGPSHHRGHERCSDRTPVEHR